MNRLFGSEFLFLTFMAGIGVAYVGAMLRLSAFKRKAANDSAALNILQAQQKALIDSIDDLAWLKDSESRFILVNRKFGQVFGVDPSTLIGKTDFDLCPHELASRYKHDDREVMRLRKPHRHEERIVREHGEIGWSETIKVPVLDANGEVVGTAGIARDISERRNAQERMEFLAHSDALTGLGNRAQLAIQFERFLDRFDSFALLFLDLDHFKMINDTDGHGVGDQLLILLAQRLRVCLMPDAVLVRLGGDEFLALLPGITDKNIVDQIAHDVTQTVAEPYSIGNNIYTISTSIGIVKFPEHGADSQTLIKHADLAMYEAKKAGRNRFQWFSFDLASHIHARRSIETRLREALNHDKFELYYQPLFDLHTQSIIGAEALLRLVDSGQEPISPAQFIPIAEDSSLIIPIGEWVLRHAIQQLRDWNLCGKPLTLSVNISGLQFQKNDFADTLMALLAEFDVPTYQLELELSETVLMDNIECIQTTLNRIRERGVRVTIDDFGSGSCSLTYLKYLPVDRLKIDRSFVSGLPEHAGDVAITRSIMNIAAAFELQVTAEGIEQMDQQEFLQSLGCLHGQGFLYSKALSIDAFNALLASH